MERFVDIRVPAESINSTEFIDSQLRFASGKFKYKKLLKRSIDARQKKIFYQLRFVLSDNEIKSDANIKFLDVSNAPEVHIVGFGPSGMFAALELIHLGYKPIVFERGKNVDNRKVDVSLLNKEGKLNTESNWCFGEGGAGTYSDGKLYTRSSKKGDVKKVLKLFVQHGANENILIDAHPHIGTDKLSNIVKKIRHTIEECGGKVYFERKIVDIEIKDNSIRAIYTNKGDKIDCNKLILATGHSANDIYNLLESKSVIMQSKPFALGVRVEHPQQLIDDIQYHNTKRGDILPAATYSLVEQIKNRGVYSFCMCPGGILVPSASSSNEMVINGMSNSKRNSKWANSGIIVEVQNNDLLKYSKYNHFSAFKFREEIENKAFLIEQNIKAPAQRMVDFCNNIKSNILPESSYHPGLNSVQLTSILPDFIAVRLKLSFKLFDKKMPGFYTNEALLLGVESRTSSPITILRDSKTLEHVQIKGLFPCGEGAGYSGGITSSAIDGINCAQGVVNSLSL